MDYVGASLILTFIYMGLFFVALLNRSRQKVGSLTNTKILIYISMSSACTVIGWCVSRKLNCWCVKFDIFLGAGFNIPAWMFAIPAYLWP